MDWRDFDLYDDKKLLIKKWKLEGKIKKRVERIEKIKLERKQFQKELKDVSKKLTQYSKFWDIKPQIKHKPQKDSSGKKNGKFYHQMEINSFWGSGIMYVSIGVDDIYKTKTDEEWKERGRMEYRRRVSNLNKELMGEILIDYFGISD